MTRKPDTPCAACGKLIYSGSTSLPAGQRRCLPCRRAGRTAGETPEPPAAAPVATEDGFGPRGTRLWRDMAGTALSPAERVLLEEACRLADRLDRLDDFLTGRGDVWLRFHARNEDGSIVRVVVDRALSEARQQADTLRGIIADLVRKQGAKVSEEPEASPSDELANRRADRRAGLAAGL